MGRVELDAESWDDRREAAIASTPCLDPNFKPSGVTNHQLAKFQELHRRRLKLKSKSKPKSHILKKSQDQTGKCQHEDANPRDSTDEDASTAIEDSSVFSVKTHNNSSTSSAQQENVAAKARPNKRRKLHWGLDTKERWERKANM